MKSLSKFKASVVASGCALLLTACALTPEQVAQNFDAKSTTIAAARSQALTQRAPETGYTIIRGNYLGGNVIAANNGSGLPAKFRDVSLSSAYAMGPLQMVANNIQVLGLNVRLSQDVSATGTPVIPTAPGVTAPPVSQVPVLVPLNFKGDLSDYLNLTTGKLGVNWEYNPTTNEVYIFKSLTRSCTVMDVPGAIDFDDKMSGTGSSSVGATGGTSGTSSFGTSSNANLVAASYDPWTSLLEALKILVTPTGRFSGNKATGTVVVTDTKEGVDRVCNHIAAESARMNLQVAIDVREIIVQLNEGNSLGLDLNLVYQQLNAITGSPDWVFKFNAPSNLSDGGSGSVGFNIARPQSRLAGSNIAAQALAAFGKVVSERTDTILTRNRVPGRYQRVTEQVYLASTTPASGGGATGGGAGVPGLTPGTVSYGSTIIIVPTVGDNNQVVLHLLDTQSDLLSINSVTTGNGPTFQQINTPALSKRKFAQSFSMQQGETLILVGSDFDSQSSSTNTSLTGASNNTKHTKGMSVLMVTTRVMTGS